MKHFVLIIAFNLFSLATFGARCDAILAPVRGLQTSSWATEDIVAHYKMTKTLSSKDRTYNDSNQFKQALEKATENLPGLINIADAVVKATENNPTLIVGIGGSPSIILSLIQEKYPKLKVLSLPLSVPHLPHDLTDIGSRDMKLTDRMLNKQQVREVMQTWEMFLPKPSEIQKHKILVLDFSSSGDSLMYARALIDAYYKLDGLNIPIESFAFHEAGIRDSSIPLEKQTAASGKTHWSYQMPWVIAELFIFSEFKALSQYPSYVPGYTKPETLITRSEYIKFKAYLRKTLNFSSN